MLFVNKLCLHIKYCNITHDIHDLVFKSVCLFDMNPENIFLFTVNNKDTELMPLKSFYCLHS